MIQEALKLKLKTPGFRRPWGATKTNTKEDHQHTAIKENEGASTATPFEALIGRWNRQLFSKGLNKELFCWKF